MKLNRLRRKARRHLVIIDDINETFYQGCIKLYKSDITLYINYRTIDDLYKIATYYYINSYIRHKRIIRFDDRDVKSLLNYSKESESVRKDNHVWYVK